MLIAGAGLMLFAGVLFALTRNFAFLLIAGGDRRRDQPERQ